MFPYYTGWFKGDPVTGLTTYKYRNTALDDDWYMYGDNRENEFILLNDHGVEVEKIKTGRIDIRLEIPVPDDNIFTHLRLKDLNFLGTLDDGSRYRRSYYTACMYYKPNQSLEYILQYGQFTQEQGNLNCTCASELGELLPTTFSNLHINDSESKEMDLDPYLDTYLEPSTFFAGLEWLEDDSSDDDVGLDYAIAFQSPTHAAFKKKMSHEGNVLHHSSYTLTNTHVMFIVRKTTAVAGDKYVFPYGPNGEYIVVTLESHPILHFKDLMHGTIPEKIHGKKNFFRFKIKYLSITEEHTTKTYPNPCLPDQQTTVQHTTVCTTPSCGVHLRHVAERLVPPASWGSGFHLAEYTSTSCYGFAGHWYPSFPKELFLITNQQILFPLPYEWQVGDTYSFPHGDHGNEEVQFTVPHNVSKSATSIGFEYTSRLRTHKSFPEEWIVNPCVFQCLCGHPYFYECNGNSVDKENSSGSSSGPVHV